MAPTVHWKLDSIGAAGGMSRLGAPPLFTSLRCPPQPRDIAPPSYVADCADRTPLK